MTGTPKSDALEMEIKKVRQWLVAHRRLHGVGLRPVAKQMGISAATVCRFENRQQVFTDTLVKIMKWAEKNGY